jgi:hypothetical protein
LGGFRRANGPSRRTRQPVLQNPGDQLVSISVRVHRHRQHVPDRPFDREAPAVDFRLQPFDDDALAAGSRVERYI